MNTTELADVDNPAVEVESESLEQVHEPRQRVAGAVCAARVRYSLLAGIALLTLWLALTVRNSLSEINAHVDMIQANLLAVPKVR